MPKFDQTAMGYVLIASAVVLAILVALTHWHDTRYRRRIIDRFFFGSAYEVGIWLRLILFAVFAIASIVLAVRERLP